MQENIHVKFTVEISPDEYSWDKTGTGEMKLNLPLDILRNLDPGNLFEALVDASVVDYIAKSEVDEEE